MLLRRGERKREYLKKIMAGVIVLAVLTVAKGVLAKEEEYNLGKIVITATKVRQYEAEVGSSLSVISFEELRKKGKRNIVEALQDVLGVIVTQSGSFGGQATIYLRGSKPGHTLIMINGIKVNDPMSPDRSFDLANLTTDDIEKIEIVRGPQSTLYGSDAMGGVINIITKKGGGRPKWKVSLENGSYNTFKGNINLSGSKRKFDYFLSSSFLDSKGISKAKEGLEEDAYKNISFSSWLRYHILKNVNLNFALHYTDAKVDIDDGAFDDDPNNVSWNENLFSKLEFTQKVNRGWDHKLVFSYVNICRKYQDEPDNIDSYDNTDSCYKGKREGIEWQHNFSLSRGSKVITGFEYEKEVGSSDGVWGGYSVKFDKRSVDTIGYYLQSHLKLKKYLFLTPGLRVDKHEMFGTKTTYKLSTVYIIPKTKTRFKANWGTGFKAPSLYQLYSSYGSPDLKPEESEGYDFGIQQAFFNGRLTFDLTYFQNNFKNLIDFVNFQEGYVNIGKVETKGVETGIVCNLTKDLTVNVNHTYLETRDKTTRQELLRRPKNKAFIGINWQISKKTHLSLNTTYIGKREDIKYVDWIPQRIDLKPYIKVDLSASHNLDKNFRIFGKVENLFNEEYEEVYGYATAGVSFYVGIEANF